MSEGNKNSLSKTFLKFQKSLGKSFLYRRSSLNFKELEGLLSYVKSSMHRGMVPVIEIKRPFNNLFRRSMGKTFFYRRNSLNFKDIFRSSSIIYRGMVPAIGNNKPLERCIYRKSLGLDPYP